MLWKYRITDIFCNWVLAMATISFIILFPLLFLPVFPSPWEDCPPVISCGQLGNISYPFTNKTTPEVCGPFVVQGCNEEKQKIQLLRGSRKWYDIQSVSKPQSRFINEISITDNELQLNLNYNKCESFNFNLPIPHPFSFHITSNLTTLFKCDRSVDSASPHFYFDSDSNFSSYKDCPNFNIYYYTHNDYASLSPNLLPPHCSIVLLPVNTQYSHHDNIFRMLTATNFSLQLSEDPDCCRCHVFDGGKCKVKSNGEFETCINLPRPYKESIQPPDAKSHKGWRFKLGIGFGCFAALLIILMLLFFFYHRYYRKDGSSKFLPANTSHLFSKSDLERSNLYFGVSIFTYTELEEATNNFASENELGDGGFGTVYCGKLPDGREVAVKRLYERNYRKVQQFLNEIEILTRLRHTYLVSLYGCTSRHSHELLLVYEYIPNGTVADHLHGDQAISSPLTWPIRMRIAIETASALVYLHASDVIHRDVKTNNILLDNNFCVKVADFGISRLFPSDVSHISTAPQGTPGYVDPEYYQCYQLTDKSDVYSFGVVLVELISSMPAVDITRHRHEINLANLALNKIQRCAFDELIDSSLGYQSDEEVKRMTTCVAELAFLCLQQDKEMRPPMYEVLEELKRIERREYEQSESQEEEHDDA